MALEEYKGVFIFAEQVDNALSAISFELLARPGTSQKIWIRLLPLYFWEVVWRNLQIHLQSTGQTGLSL